MIESKILVSAKLNLLRCSASLAVLSAAIAMTPTAAYAQDQEPEQEAAGNTPTGPGATEAPVEEGTIIVTGTRRALQTSQDRERNADTVVDSITATDIGAFPDKSVAEALQRVPGITVNRFAASDDTSHFSAEPSNVLIRGLQQVRNEINGRDTFSANSSRGLGFADVSPELLAGIDTYKNQTADMIEGGIAGTVNIRTRVPFDATGQLIQGTFNINYGDIARKATPEFSLFYSNRFDTPIGEFGIMANLAYSEVQTASQGVTYGRMGIFDNFVAREGAPRGTPVYGPGTRYIPSSAGYRDTTYDRERQGVALAAQWQDPSRTFLLTAQYNRSQYENTWRERGVIANFFDMFAIPTDFRYSPTGPRNTWAPTPAMGTPAFTFDEEGNFESGTLNIQQTDTFWWGASENDSRNIAVNDQGEAMLQPCYNWQATCANPVRAPDINAVTRLNQNRNMTQDAALNLRWNASDKLRVTLDAQYVDSTVENYDIEVGQYSFADVRLDASGGRRPELTFLDPTNINQSAGGLTNPNNYRYNHVMDHIEDSEGNELALRADGEYDFDTEWLDSLRFGARFADRDQTVRYSAFNWANIANNWNLGNNQNIYWNIDRHQPNGVFSGYPQGLYENSTFGGSYFGGSGEFVFANFDALESRAINQLAFSRLGVGQDRWAPICEREGEVEDSCFRPAELNDVSEETKAAYAMLRFGSRSSYIGGLRVSGNIGVRYVRTLVESTGSLNYARPFTLPSAEQCTGELPPPEPGQPVPEVPRPVGCYLSPADISFASGGGAESSVRTSHEHWLPSFNLRIDLSRTWLIRFAASKALSRPDIGLLKNYVAVNSSLPGEDGSDPRYVRDAAGTIVGVNPTYTADAYNPRLAPTTAWQFDVSLENYFANVGSFSLAGFYKKFDNYIQYGAYNQEVTNNGVTRNVQVRGPVNGEGAEVMGFEVAYQRFFDFLPEPFNGFGIQANYTFVENNGITNTNLMATGQGGGGTATPLTSGTVIQVDALEGLSRHAFNLVGMYEKGPLAIRLAYNWRSKYLVTAVDCCVSLPIWQESAGFLDGSIRYSITPNIELSVQASNLLDTETKLMQQVTDSDDGGILTPNAWLHSDRRFVLGARFRF